MAKKPKQIGIAILGDWKYKMALEAVKAAGGTELDKEKIFEEYKKIGGRYVEMPVEELESYHKVMGLVVGVEPEAKPKKEKKLGGIKKGKKK